MKKVLALFTLILVVGCFIATSALAYDDLISNDWGLNLTTPGQIPGNIGILYRTAGDAFDADGEKQELADDATDLRVLVKGEYGIIENLSAFVILPFDKWDMGDFGESGLADIWLGAKYQVMPLLHIRGALNLPMGDDEKFLGNAGGFGVDVAAATGKMIDKIGVRGQLGFRYNGEDSDTKWAPGMGVYLEGGVGYFADKYMAGISLEFMNTGDGQADGNDVDDSGINWVELAIGGDYHLSEKIDLGAGILYGLIGKNTNANLGIMVGLNYQFGE